ncbi:hypothetical protein [Phaeospirillum tilakii]|uniref:Peptidase n=1 Tax=Phaeospirillum tilakii TaxID=741673 RepID=A0ABW5CE54_9PROT
MTEPPAPSAEPAAEPAPAPAASYDDLVLPEGLSPDAETGAAFRSLAAEAGLSRDTAQKLVDLQAGLIRKQGDAARDTARAWAKDAAADAEYGGADFARNAGIARQALQAFATPALVELLDNSGLGNHPELIRAFYRVGKAMAEDGRVGGSAAPRPDRLAALYPTMVPKE